MKPKVRQVPRVAVRRRHDQLLIAMTEVATELLRVDSEHQAIARALGIISDVIGAKRAFAFEAKNTIVHEDTAKLHCSWDAPATDREQCLRAVPPSVGCPPEFVGLLNGKVVTAGRSGSSKVQVLLEQIDLASVLLVPIMIDESYWGFIGFDTGQIETPWTPDEIKVFQVVAGLIGATISQQHHVKQLGAARDEALQKRAEAEKANASKTNFLTSMSHELRSPLNAILGFSSMMMSGSPDPVGLARHREYASDIHQSGTHLLSLINDLLDIAKIDAGRMEIEPRILATQDALDHALNVVGAMASERKQTLVISVAPEAATLYADERAFIQIIINLVSNAVKFAPEGGHISVSAKNDTNGDFEIAVENDGPGIPKEKLDLLFQPFSQADNRFAKQGGTGLGLALVRGLVGLHGGRVWLESEEGVGTRAIVVLKMSDKSCPGDARREHKASAA